MGSRLIKKSFLEELFRIMKPKGVIEFKTDDADYFWWSMNCFRHSSFEIAFFTEDLLKSFRKDQNFITHFESISIKKNEPTYYCLLRKPIN